VKLCKQTTPDDQDSVVVVVVEKPQKHKMKDVNGLVFWLKDLGLEENSVAPVPLKSVSIKAEVIEFVSQITIEQKYVNVEDTPIESPTTFRLKRRRPWSVSRLK